MKRVLVTGGAGFLGSHLCERLLADGREVLCVDDLSTGARENVSHLLANPRFELLLHDIAGPLGQLYVDVEEIYNLACPASPVHYQRDPISTLKTNVLGTIYALELAWYTGARLLQASTSEVYGDPLEHPQTESYWGNVNPIGPRACYDEGKRVAETLCFDYRRQRQVDVVVARIFNTYGPRMRTDDGRVVSNFIVNALRGMPLEIHGDGSQTRSFCYVSDAVEALVRLMASDVSGPVNIGNPHEVTVMALAIEVKTMTFSASPIVLVARPENDPSQRRPDITFARQRLHWEPIVPLAQGLALTIADFHAREEDQTERFAYG